MKRLIVVLAMATDVLAVRLAGWGPGLVLAMWQLGYFRLEASLDDALGTIELLESSLRHPANGSMSAQLDYLEAL